MSDMKKTLTTDEYQFPQEEEFQAAEASAEIQASEPLVVNKPETWLGQLKTFFLNFDWMKHKRILLTIAIAILASVLFKVMKPHSATTKSAAELQMEAAAQQQAQMEGQINALKQGENVNENSTETLASQLQILKQAVNQAVLSQAQTNDMLNSLTEQVKQLADEVHANKTKIAAPQSLVPPLVYHLKAVIDGRAWIEDNKGLTDTVSLGDDIKDYGTVNSIDADKGVVTTSSGKTINYGRADS